MGKEKMEKVKRREMKRGDLTISYFACMRLHA